MASVRRLLACAAVAAVLAGCAGGPTQQDPEAGDATASPVEARPEPDRKPVEGCVTAGRGRARHPPAARPHRRPGPAPDVRAGGPLPGSSRRARVCLPDGRSRGRARSSGARRRTAERRGPDRSSRPGSPVSIRSATDPERSQLTVVGDVMLARGVDDPRPPWHRCRPLLRRADLTVGNLESTLSRRGARPRAATRSVAARPCWRRLRRAGFDALSLANNHTGDYGTARAARHRARCSAQPDRAVRRRAVDARRGGPTGRRRARWRPVRLPRASTPSARLRRRGPGRPGALSVRMPPRTGPLVRADLDRVLGAVRRAARQADVVVVLPHWGTQYTHVPEPVQRQVGRAAGPGRRRPRRGRPPALGPGHRRGARRAGAALAGQLRLRHGLHAPDDGGRRPPGDLLGAAAQGVRLAALPRWTPGPSRRAGWRAPTPRTGSWRTSGRPAPARSPRVDLGAGCCSAGREPGHHGPRRTTQLGPLDDGGHVARRVVAGVRRAAEPHARQPGSRTNDQWSLARSSVSALVRDLGPPRGGREQLRPASGPAPRALLTGTTGRHRPGRGRPSRAASASLRLRRGGDEGAGAVVVVVVARPRGSSAPNATQDHRQPRPGCSAAPPRRASSTPTPDALSSAPGACGHRVEVGSDQPATGRPGPDVAAGGDQVDRAARRAPGTPQETPPGVAERLPAHVPARGRRAGARPTRPRGRRPATSRDAVRCLPARWRTVASAVAARTSSGSAGTASPDRVRPDGWARERATGRELAEGPVVGARPGRLAVVALVRARRSTRPPRTSDDARHYRPDRRGESRESCMDFDSTWWEQSRRALRWSQ